MCGLQGLECCPVREEEVDTRPILLDVGALNCRTNQSSLVPPSYVSWVVGVLNKTITQDPLLSKYPLVIMDTILFVNHLSI